MRGPYGHSPLRRAIPDLAGKNHRPVEHVQVGVSTEHQEVGIGQDPAQVVFFG